MRCVVKYQHHVDDTQWGYACDAHHGLSVLKRSSRHSIRLHWFESDTEAEEFILRRMQDTNNPRYQYTILREHEYAAELLRAMS